VGESAKTSRTVSLNAGMLAKPAAVATSAIGSDVVSTAARRLRPLARGPRASGPAPELGGSPAVAWREL
jgi:hypothetical protein